MSANSLSSGPIRIFVAATTAEWLPARLLEFSIRECPAWPLEVRAIESFGRHIPRPAHKRNLARTPFSFQRFLIPEFCAYQGRAIYLDADMQVFSDMADLWTMPMGNHDLLTVDGGALGRKGQFSVMLLNCESLKWRIEDIVDGLDRQEYSYEELLHDMCLARSVGRDIPAGWNSLEHHEPQATRLLHYTDMNAQPWVAVNNAFAHLWVACLRRAVSAGFITLSDIEREVKAGHVRPSLLAQIESKFDDPLALPVNERRRLDRKFIAPYKCLDGHRWRRWASWGRRLLTSR